MFSLNRHGKDKSGIEHPKYYTMKYLKNENCVIVSSEVLPNFHGNWKEINNNRLIELDVGTLEMVVHHISGRIYLPTWNTMKTLLTSIETFMKDIVRLVQEQQTEIANYHLDPSPLTNPALFKTRAKFIEQCLLLGVCAEHLLKAILLKHDFIINKEVKNLAQKKFNQGLLNRIIALGNRQDQGKSDSIYHEAETMLGVVSGETISFRKCIALFYTDVVQNVQSYFSGIPDNLYTIANEDTRVFYGDAVNTSNALEKIRTLRNNYAHLPDPMYEENGLVPFLYNFLLFVAQKEFQSEMAGLPRI